MRKLVLLVCVFAGAACLIHAPACRSGIIPSWESASGKLGFYPISNEVSIYKNYDDSGDDRGETFQIISINSFKLYTTFSFEFTGDFNWKYSHVDPGDLSAGKNNHDYYIELSVVKPVTELVSLNIQRIMATFEEEPINQFGVRLCF